MTDDEWILAYDEALAAGSEPPPVPPGMDAVRRCLDELHAQAATHIGRFVIRRLLGRGGNGVVFLAFDPVLGREVALKVPRAEMMFDPEFHDRFLCEGQAAAPFRHPNVVTIYEAGQDGPVCYLATAYCPGGSLADWLRSHPEPLPLSAAARLVALVARAVHYVHGCGVVHRDLKPSNILLDFRADAPPEHAVSLGSVRLTPLVADFGLARAADDPDGGASGTPNYMAPEPNRGPLGDVYALGCVLYELIAAPTHSPTRPGGVPADLVAIGQKCLAHDPTGRYPSAAALADDLDRFTRGDVVAARPAGPLRHGWRWARRSPGLAGLTAALGLAIAVGVAGVLWQWHAADNARREAEASERQTRELLHQLLPSDPAAPQVMRAWPRRLDLGTLTRTEAYLAGRVYRRPDDGRARVALTHVRGAMGSVLAALGRLSESDAMYAAAHALWSEDDARPVARDWRAATHLWLSMTAMRQSRAGPFVEHMLAAHALWSESEADRAKAAECRRELFAVRRPMLNWDDVGPTLAAAREASAGRTRAFVCLLFAEHHHTRKRADDARPLWLSRCYDRLIAYARKAGDESAVEDARRRSSR